MSNEVTLSTDLNTVTAEIRSYQNIGGQAIYEIGRRLKWVKQHDLAHGEYGKWLDSMNIDATFAKRAVKISEEFSNSATLPDLGASALYLIASMPPDERTKPHLTDDGEIKTPEEMSVRQLQSLKTQLKERDATITNLFAENSQLKAHEPEVVEKRVEVPPADYEQVKRRASSLADELDYLKQRNANLEKEISEKTAAASKFQEDSAEYSKLKDDITALEGKQTRLERKVSAAAHIVDLKGNVEDLLNLLAPELYAADFATFRADDPIIKSAHGLINNVSRWVEDMASIMPDDRIIEGDVNDL